MAHLIDVDHDEQYLLPPCIEDWVPPTHPARFIREFVDTLDLTACGIRWAPGEGGRPAYASRLLVNVWRYGYYEGVRSCRKLEKACRDHVGLIWLTGMHAPDHNTLNAFFRANRDGIRRLFKKTVEVAIAADLVGFVLHALDGTKIQAQVANRTGLHAQGLQKLLEKLDKRIAALEEALAQSETDPEWSDALPEALGERQALRTQVQAALNRLDAAGEKHLHPGDEEARVMKCADRNMNTFGYNAQAVADAQAGIVVACDVVQEENDEHQLNAMIDKVAEQAGRPAERTVADTGYATGAELMQAETNHRDVVVALPETMRPNPDKPYTASNFTYDAARDVCMCPHGGELALRGVRGRKDKGYILRRYRCAVQDCAHRADCTKDKKGRTIERNQYYDVVKRQYEKQQEAQAKADLATRRHTIEPVFAFVKQHLGFRRFTVSGLDNVRTQWSLHCTTYNLHKLFRHWHDPKRRLQTPTPMRAPSALGFVYGVFRRHHAAPPSGLPFGRLAVPLVSRYTLQLG